MSISKRILCFAPQYNTDGENDATGAFQPEARAAMKVWGSGCELVMFDNRKSMAARKTQVAQALVERYPTTHLRAPTGGKMIDAWDGVAFFCHGWGAGIQAGFRNADVEGLAEMIDQLCAVGDVDSSTADDVEPHVVLYCCSTGEDVPETKKDTAAGTGDNSFADRLRDELCKVGLTRCRVMGHSTVAHTTQNPNARFFDGMGSTHGGTGGYPVIALKSALWAQWKIDLQKSDLRFRFPFMSIEEIHAEVSGAKANA